MVEEIDINDPAFEMIVINEHRSGVCSGGYTKDYHAIALEVIKLHGDDAGDYAGSKASSLIKQGNMAGGIEWLKVLDAIEDIEWDAEKREKIQ